MKQGGKIPMDGIFFILSILFCILGLFFFLHRDGTKENQNSKAIESVSLDVEAIKKVQSIQNEANVMLAEKMRLVAEAFVTIAEKANTAETLANQANIQLAKSHNALPQKLTIEVLPIEFRYRKGAPKPGVTQNPSPLMDRAGFNRNKGLNN